MDERRLTGISRVLSHALRHDPGYYGLMLDPEGWVDLKDMVAALRRTRGRRDVTAADVEQAVATASKQRHEIRDGRIRALYGHTVDVRIEYRAAVPPDVLYHGTSPAKVGLVLARGLLPMARQKVHMSADVEMATAVGSRHSPTPMILQVDAAAAHAHGIEFYPGSERIWMADEVPPAYLSVFVQE